MHLERDRALGSTEPGCDQRNAYQGLNPPPGWTGYRGSKQNERTDRGGDCACDRRTPPRRPESSRWGTHGEAKRAKGTEAGTRPQAARQAGRD